jgi:hypothetical protein
MAEGSNEEDIGEDLVKIPQPINTEEAVSEEAVKRPSAEKHSMKRPFADNQRRSSKEAIVGETSNYRGHSQ